MLEHAPEADRVLVHLGYLDDGCELTVHDVATHPPARRAVPPVTAGGHPGPGRGPGTGLGIGLGIGLSGLRQRIAPLGGTLTAGPEGPGFLVRLWLPRRDR